MRIAGAVLLLALSLPAQADELSGRPRVIDGDTLAFGDAKVRLNGIDAPETDQTCQNRAGDTFRCGNMATAALMGAIGGAVIECRGDQHDRYLRLIATCWRGVEDLNQWMVLDGWAVAYRKYSMVYAGAEDIAHARKLGLWAGDFEAPWDWRKSHPR